MCLTLARAQCRMSLAYSLFLSPSLDIYIYIFVCFQESSSTVDDDDKSTQRMEITYLSSFSAFQSSAVHTLLLPACQCAYWMQIRLVGCWTLWMSIWRCRHLLIHAFNFYPFSCSVFLYEHFYVHVVFDIISCQQRRWASKKANKIFFLYIDIVVLYLIVGCYLVLCITIIMHVL
jgi:hypothetical protein